MHDRRSSSWLVNAAALVTLLALARWWQKASDTELREGTPTSIVQSRKRAVLPTAVLGMLLSFGSDDMTVLGHIGVGVGVWIVAWLHYRWTVRTIADGTHPYFRYHPEQRKVPNAS